MLHTLIGEETSRRDAAVLRASRRRGGHLRGLRPAHGRRLGPRSRPVHALVRAGRHARAEGRAQLRPGAAGADARDQPEHAARRRASRRSCRSTCRSGWASSAPDGAAQPLQLEGENEPKGTDRVLELTEATQSFTFLGLPSRAGAVAAARLLGAGEARCRLRRRRARASDGPRQRCVHALGRRPAAGRATCCWGWSAIMPRAGRAARSTRGWSRRSRPAWIARPRTRPSPPGRCRCRAAAISASRWP